MYVQVGRNNSDNGKFRRDFQTVGHFHVTSAVFSRSSAGISQAGHYLTGQTVWLIAVYLYMYMYIQCYASAALYGVVCHLPCVPAMLQTSGCRQTSGSIDIAINKRMASYQRAISELSASYQQSVSKTSSRLQRADSRKHQQAQSKLKPISQQVVRCLAATCRQAICKLAALSQ